MATVGSLASTQLAMAQVSTKYGLSSSSLTSTTLSSASSTSSSKSSSSSSAASENLTNLLNTTLKNKSSYFKEQYSNLYKSIYGITDDDTEETVDNTVSLKSAASSTQSSAEALTSYAKNLKYGGEYDEDTYSNLAQKFVDNYNSMVDKLGDSENQSVLQKGVVMVNTAKVYSSALKRAGITVGSDNKLTFNKDNLSDVDATDIKTTFGVSGFSDKTAQKAQQIKSMSGSTGGLTYTSSSTTNYAYSIGALFSLYA
jgi:hypothetical protein